MEQYTVEVNHRSGSGSPTSRHLRREGRIPSVVYARGEKAVSVQMSYRDFVRVAEVSRISQVFTLKSDIAEVNGRLAVVKEIQRDHLKNQILHVDFQALHENEEIHMQVPVKISGESPGVKNQGGILTIVSREITVRCLPKLIPGELTVDVSNLALGQSIHACDVPLPNGVKLHGNPDETIVAVVAIRQVEEEAPAATAGAVPAEGVAAAPAEGAAAPAGGAAAPAAGAAAKAPAGGKEKK